MPSLQAFVAEVASRWFARSLPTESDELSFEIIQSTIFSDHFGVLIMHYTHTLLCE
jgi:hypothetical protein